MKEKSVVAVVGMPGSGKATIRKIAEAFGYSVVVMGDEIREEACRRGLEPTPENIGRIMLQLRNEEGPNAVAKRCMSKIVGAKTSIVFVDGVRSLNEVEEFRKRALNLTIVALHTSPETRFHRLFNRKRSDDPTGWDVFLERDLRELSVGQGNVIAMADHMIVNEGSYEELNTRVHELLEILIKNWTK
jgi:dephospho-CoA kinase